MDRISSLLYKLFEEYKFVRRAVLTWALCIVTITILKFLEIADKLSGASSVFISIIGLVTISIGLYQWDRARDKQ